jgi:general transcription factor 3C polypeptide 3 (transcription factor C subunit 4)
LDEKHRNTFQFTDENRIKWAERKQGRGNPYHLKELDPELYAFYGHQMNVGQSPLTALNYYFRAYAMKPDDTMLNLCLGIAYICSAFKRQSTNLQYQIQQGLSFISRYYESRSSQEKACYRQEAEFNVGLIFHSLGLNHLALPAYERCIKMSESVREEASNAGAPLEDFAIEAAFAKRSILAINGDVESAQKVAKEWLVI